jgi:uncharacterized protein YggE
MAKEKVIPDQADLRVTAFAEHRNLSEAKRQHDTKLKQLFSIANELDIAKKHLKSEHVSIQPRYRYLPEKRRVFEGYQVQSTINVHMESLSKVGNILQKLTDAGFDRIGNVAYGKKDMDAIREQILLKAVDNAKAKAEKIAKRLGVEVGKPVKVVESSTPSSRPYRAHRGVDMMARADAVEMAAVAPPAGELQISNRIHITFEIE